MSTKRLLKHLDLLSGIGGFALSANWAGIETVAFCEIDPACRAVLRKHWPGTTIESDIKDLDGKDYADVDIITGGYPCQPFSVAGSQKASEDPRHIWPEVFRVIKQAKPAWAIFENVYGHVNLGLDDVLHDLESIGYATQSFVVSSVGAGANHNRQRVYIVAHSSSDGLNEGSVSRRDAQAPKWTEEGQEKIVSTKGCSRIWAGLDRRGNPTGRYGTQPPPLRVDAELPGRMDRNRMLGNAIDPMIAYKFFKTIKEYAYD